MNTREIRKRIQELNRLSYLYYNGQTSVSDQVWDNLVQELKNATPKSLEARRLVANFFNQVGAPVDRKAKKVKHDHPMLSLNTMIDRSKDRKLKELLQKTTTEDNPIWVFEHKLDGIALSLVYEDGHLVHAATRGNGIVGEDVTHLIQGVQGILPTIPPDPGRVTIRGEVVIPKDTQLDGYNNLRNAASGILRGKDPSLKHHLHFVAYDLIMPSGLRDYTSQKAKMDYLQNIGFKTSVICQLWSVDDIIAYYQHEYDQIVSKSLYECDGIVVKIDDIQRQKELGHTAKYPRWAFALKRNNQDAITTILEISEQTGKTGKVTPVAYLEPVKLGTVTVSKISLYSRKYVQDKGIREGQRITITRAGGVIPVFKSIVENDADTSWS